ncbi:MAG: metallophosphoesterase [Deltaproteobacteria bacterium]|nr:metallophosphoesterase [Deltaproteobacteria bacterium]MBN2672796.1 metallophosphoesterase [Deltaproteobacteria bacterium]
MKSDNTPSSLNVSRRRFIRAGLSGAVLLGCYPLFVERNIVLVNEYRIPVRHLPRLFNGYRIAHLTDLHYGALVSAGFIDGVIQRTNALKPDLVCLTGDYVHARNTTAEIDEVWPLLQKLSARDGVTAVLGNHDHWADTERSLQWMHRSGFGIRHAGRAVIRGNERLMLGGAGDFYEDIQGIDRAFARSDDADCRVLLAHNPDTIDTSFHTRVDLTLCGHTHGGQVKIPFGPAPILPVRNKAYTEGLIRTPKTQLFISRGIGWAVLPLRFNCYPEIALLRLVCV